jgi:hypothetical protein
MVEVWTSTWTIQPATTGAAAAELMQLQHRKKATGGVPRVAFSATDVLVGRKVDVPA